MKRKLLRKFKLIYIIDTFIQVIIYKIRSGVWPVAEITVDELFDRLNSDEPPILLDIRMASYFDSRYGHIRNAKSYPIMKMIKKIDDLHLFKESEVITMCYGGGLSLVAAEILAQAGFKDVKSLYGGTDLWAKKRYPTTVSGIS